MLLIDQDKKLLNAIHTYQESKDGTALLSRLKLLKGKFGHILWSVISGSDISRDAKIASTVRLPHLTGVVIHKNSIVSDGCMIMQQVTLGEISEGGAPHLEEGVYVGAGAKILGKVRISVGARIGANAVVLTDVPAGATAVGIPARIIPSESEPA